MADIKNTPEVQEYRLDQLEKTVKEGFRDLRQDIALMSKNFVTKSELEDAERKATSEHNLIREDISDVKLEVDELKKWKDTIVTRIAVYAILGLVAMVLAQYGLEKIL